MQLSTQDDQSMAAQGDDTPARELCFLVAEDHEFQRSMIVQMLEQLGATGVYEAEDGRTAMEITRELDHPFDIIVTDIDMPGMDGLSFIRRLGEAGVGASLIVTSSLDRPLLDTIETMSAAYGMRLLGAIEKPLTQDRLAEMIALHWRAKPNPERPRPGAGAYTLDEILAGLREDEFEPFYQPKVELRTGRVKGAEALARWRHPRNGIILPSAFLGLLEDNSQISELTWAMLAQGARDCRSWRDTGLDLDVSVNLSGKQLADPGISDAITWQVTQQGLDPKHMILEITESAAITEVGRVLENLTRLRMKGFGLSIDDYGTGYSSMQQLTRIPFTELKIDQSFVMHAARQESSRLILESSLEMAKKLKIVSVAEGVETQDDWNLLRQTDCDLAQGFHIARPMPSGELAEWVRHWG